MFDSNFCRNYLSDQMTQRMAIPSTYQQNTGILQNIYNMSPFDMHTMSQRSCNIHGSSPSIDANGFSTFFNDLYPQQSHDTDRVNSQPRKRSKQIHDIESNLV